MPKPPSHKSKYSKTKPLKKSGGSRSGNGRKRENKNMKGRKITEKGFTSSSSSNGLGSLLYRLIFLDLFLIPNLPNRTFEFWRESGFAFVFFRAKHTLAVQK